MRFIDEAKIRVSGGHGGPGCISFRRETFIPRGGPDGGNGGAGGQIIFIASDQLGTLQDFRFKRAYQAPNGQHGSGANKSGRDGEDIVIRVPTGTLIRDAETAEVLQDFTQDEETWVACKGGRGGKGNSHFTTSTHQAPKFAQPGEDGEHRELKLELKLLADVGVIGFPNTGKSTLLSRLSAARPKIAPYPFTTLTPHLGVVSVPDQPSFVIADIPGLVEGAHQGTGLGHRFLKHIERTRLLVHLLDGAELLEDVTRPSASPTTSQEEAVENLVQRYKALRNELGLFNPELLNQPEIVVVNKLDVFESDPTLIALIQKRLNQPWMISAVTGSGLKELTFAIHRELQSRNLHRTSDKRKKVFALPDDQSIRA
jgi:GTP-binding protein